MKTAIFGLLTTIVAADWKVILDHKNTDTSLFPAAGFLTSGNYNIDNPAANVYSIIGTLNPADYLNDNGKYKFRLTYDSTTTIEWEQSSWLSQNIIEGYTPINVPDDSACDTGCKFIGLGHTQRTQTYLDGNGDGHSGWWNAVGITARHNGGIPAFNHKIAKSSTLQIWTTPEVVNSVPELVESLLDSQITASGTHASCSTNNVKPNSVKAWCANINTDSNTYLQIDLGEATQIASISTFGRVDYDQWITKYSLQYSLEGASDNEFINWKNGEELQGNRDRNTEVNHMIFLTARYLRFIPIEYNHHKSMRVAVYGNHISDYAEELYHGGDPLIVSLTDDKFSATSTHSSCATHKAKSNSGRAWCNAERAPNNDYLQIDLGKINKIGSVSTWGRADMNQWVTKYELLYATVNQDNNYINYGTLTGNEDRTTEVNHELKNQIMARYLRFKPIEYYGYTSMRVEAYKSVAEIPLVKDLPDNAISTSSTHSSCLEFIENGWCAASNTENDHIQFDLGKIRIISSISTWSRFNINQWVKEYELQYSNDDITYSIYGTLEGNNGKNTEKINILTTTISARYIRIKPTDYSGHKSMRIEIHECISSQCFTLKDPNICEPVCGSNEECNIGKCECKLGYSQSNNVCILIPVIDFTTHTSSMTIADLDANGDITSPNTVDDPENLYCGNKDTDMPIWAAILSLMEDSNTILLGLNDISSTDEATSIQEYIQCSELIYMYVSTIGPFRIFDAFIQYANFFLSVLDEIDFTGVMNIDILVNKINMLIVEALDKLRELIGIELPLGYPSWKAYYKDLNLKDSELFNPFALQRDLALLVSNFVCNKLVGNIDDLLADLLESDAVTDAKNSLSENIETFLGDNGIAKELGIFSESDRISLLDGGYKDVTIASTIGMKFCIKKGIQGCIKRAYGIAFDLNNNHEKYDTRSILIEIPAVTVSLEMTAFAYNDIMANINDIFSTKLQFDLNVKLSTKPIPGVDKIKEAWDKYSDKISSIPYVGDSEQMLGGISFLEVKEKTDEIMGEQKPLIDWILEGGTITFGIKLAIIAAGDGLLDCEGFRISLNVGSDSFGAAIFIGLDYRNELNQLQYGLDWLPDAINEGSKTFKEVTDLLLNELMPHFNVLANTMKNVGEEIKDLGDDVFNSVTNQFCKAAELGNVFMDNAITPALDFGEDVGKNIVKSFENAVDVIKQELNDFKDDVNNAKDRCIPNTGDIRSQMNKCGGFSVNTLFGEVGINVCVDEIINLSTIENAIITVMRGICSAVFDPLNAILNEVSAKTDPNSIQNIDNFGFKDYDPSNYYYDDDDDAIYSLYYMILKYCVISFIIGIIFTLIFACILFKCSNYSKKSQFHTIPTFNPSDTESQQP